MVQRDFQLIASTNRNLADDISKGRFREDLLARLNLWTFTLPGLADRREDFEPNIEFELKRFARESGNNVNFNKEATAVYLNFALSPEAEWMANFRDLGSLITRMAMFAAGGRIDQAIVTGEIQRLRQLWTAGGDDET